MPKPIVFVTIEMFAVMKLRVSAYVVLTVSQCKRFTYELIAGPFLSYVI